MGFLHSLAFAAFAQRFAVCRLYPIAAFADSPHDRTQFGHDISWDLMRKLTEVTCFGCNVRIRGQGSRATPLFSAEIFVVEDQGEIGGDLTTFGGDVRLEKEPKTSG